jgi:hypothetical protein
MENKIRKVIREQIQNLYEYLVDYVVVNNKSTGEEAARFQITTVHDRRRQTRKAEQFIQSMNDWHEKSEKDRYERYALMYKDNPEDMSFSPNPKSEYVIDYDRQSRSMEETKGERALQVTDQNGVVAVIEDPKDIEAYDRGNTVIGVTADGKKIELNIDWSEESHMVDEGMSPEEWEAAKEAERLANHPEKEKIMKIKQMMDKEEDDKEQEEWDKGWYRESLKEIASKLGYLNEDDMLNKIEKGVTAITGGGRRHASVSDRGDSIRVSFRYMRGEFDSEEWDKILKYLTGMGFEIKDESNSYEANYDREEPPEWVPTIHLKK